MRTIEPRPVELPSQLARFATALNRLVPCEVGETIYVVASALPPLHRVLKLARDLDEAREALRGAQAGDLPPGWRQDDVDALEIYGPFRVPDTGASSAFKTCYHLCSSEWICPSGSPLALREGESVGREGAGGNSNDCDISDRSNIEKIQLRVKKKNAGWCTYDYSVDADMIILDCGAFEEYIYPVVLIKRGKAAADALRAQIGC